MCIKNINFGFRYNNNFIVINVRNVRCKASDSINVACYEANALLPNGENAHITTRHPLWWKGMLDSLAPEFPNTRILLLCSTEYKKVVTFPIFSDQQRQSDPAFDIEY